MGFEPGNRTALWGLLVAGAAVIGVGELSSCVSAARADDASDLASCAPGVAAAGRLAVSSGVAMRLDDAATVVMVTVRPDPPRATPVLRQFDGRTVELRGSAGRDRWNRVAATAVFDPRSGVWVEAALVADGLAVVGARSGACGRSLLAREAGARQARRGLWADPANRPVAASELERLRAAEGRFAIVEGRVSAVGERGGTVYLNFGRRWTEDFTVRVAARDRRALARAGLDLQRLLARPVRVRGHLENRGGPSIDLTAAEQIELLGAEP